MGRALRECYEGGGKILLESQAHFSNGHISACAYPFFCQIVLFIVHTTQNSHEHQYSELLVLSLLYLLCIPPS